MTPANHSGGNCRSVGSGVNRACALICVNDVRGRGSDQALHAGQDTAHQAPLPHDPATPLPFPFNHRPQMVLRPRCRGYNPLQTNQPGPRVVKGMALCQMSGWNGHLEAEASVENALPRLCSVAGLTSTETIPQQLLRETK